MPYANTGESFVSFLNLKHKHGENVAFAVFSVSHG